MARRTTFERLCDMADVRGLCVLLHVGDRKGRGEHAYRVPEEITLRRLRGHGVPSWRQCVVGGDIEHASRRLLEQLARAQGG